MTDPHRLPDDIDVLRALTAAVAETAGDAWALFDPDSRLIWWTEALLEFFPKLRGTIRHGVSFAEMTEAWIRTDLKATNDAEVARLVEEAKARFLVVVGPIEVEVGELGQRLRWQQRHLPGGYRLRHWSAATPVLRLTAGLRELELVATAINASILIALPDGSARAFNTGFAQRMFAPYITEFSGLYEPSGRWRLWQTLAPCFNPSLDLDRLIAADTERRSLAEPILLQIRHGPWLRVQHLPLKPDRELIVTLDVTDLRARELQALEASREAERASRAKTDFLAQMSHELRTPLNAILGFSEAMLHELHGPLGSPRYRSYAEDILSSGTHLAGLIDDILDLAKAEAGKFTLAAKRIQPLDVVIGAVRLLSDTATREGITIEIDVPDRVPDLDADPRLLHQVLLNLIANAIKFTPAGGRITVSLHHAPDGWLDLLVTDTGIGIPTDRLAHVFEPFQQIEPAKDGKRVGTGLGLPISAKLMELHGGTLALDRGVAGGTIARARFPPGRVL
jgi:signal transduction histidine kinase